jgi:hypothetical protein
LSNRIASSISGCGIGGAGDVTAGTFAAGPGSAEVAAGNDKAAANAQSAKTVAILFTIIIEIFSYFEIDLTDYGLGLSPRMLPQTQGMRAAGSPLDANKESSYRRAMPRCRII